MSPDAEAKAVAPEPVAEGSAAVAAAVPASPHRRVGIFGSSLNPPTGSGGHRTIVEHFARDEALDEVLVVPVFEHIFASKRGTLAPFEHRLRMSQLAFQDLPGVSVSTLERDLCVEAQARADAGQESVAPVGTWDLIERLQRDSPDAQFVLILGTDTFRDLDSGKWRNAEKMRAAVDIFVVDRVGCEPVAASAAPSPRVVALHSIQGLGDVSSTAARAALAANDAAAAQALLSPEVLAYAQANKLYLPVQDEKN